MSLNPNTAAAVEKNWGVLFQNFRKISSWVKSGLDSQFPIPDDYAIARVFKAEQAHSTRIAELTDLVNQANDIVAKAQEDTQALAQQVAQLQAELTQLKTTGVEDPVTEAAPKKKATKKSEPKVVDSVATEVATPVAQQPDEVQLTAAAVDAGELSPEALGQVSAILDSLEEL